VSERLRRVVTGEEVSDTDRLLVSRTQPEMLGVVHERYAPSVHRYLGRQVGVRAAEDLLGDVFVAAVATRLRVRPHGGGSALPWLYGIAGNVVRSYRRRSLGQIPLDKVTAVDWDAVDDRLDAGSRRQELRVALAELTEAEREVLLQPQGAFTLLHFSCSWPGRACRLLRQRRRLGSPRWLRKELWEIAARVPVVTLLGAVEDSAGRRVWRSSGAMRATSWTPTTAACSNNTKAPRSQCPKRPVARTGAPPSSNRALPAALPQPPRVVGRHHKTQTE